MLIQLLKEISKTQNRIESRLGTSDGFDILSLFWQLVEQQRTTNELLERCLAELSQHSPTPSEDQKVKSEGNIVPDGLLEEELITIKQAAHTLGVSRWKIAKMREEGELTDYDRNGQIRLSRREVEAAKIWYSIPKGKI